MTDRGKCKAPGGVRGKSATGSVLSLDAIGPQDANYLLSNNNSHFTPSFIKSPSNAIYQRRTQFGEPSTKYFGNTVKHVFKTREMGDMLGNMYLKTQMPILSEDQAASNVTIQLPGDFDIPIPIGETVCFENSELKSLNLGASNIRYETLIRDNFNELLANAQYVGYEPYLSNVAVGFANVYGHKLGTRLLDERFMTISEPSGNTTVNVFMTVSENNVQNPSTIDGGIRNFELRDIQRPKISNDAFGFSNVHLLTLGGANVRVNLAGVSNLLPFGSTLGSNYGGNVISINSVTANIGTKFIFSNVNMAVNDLEFKTNVTRTSTATALPTKSLVPDSNAMISNIVVDGDQDMVNGDNILTIGDDFDVTYYTFGEFEENFGGANVTTATSGLLNSSISIKTSGEMLKSYININDFAFGRSHLYQADYNTTPGSNTLMDITDIEPRADTINFYQNTLNFYTTSQLSNLDANREITTPTGSRLFEVYLGDINPDPNVYVLDNSFQPIIEVTSPARNTKITLGFAQDGSNPYLQCLVNFQQTLPKQVNITGFTDTRPFFRYNEGTSTNPTDEAHGRFTISKGKIDDYSTNAGLYTAYQNWELAATVDSCRVTCASNVLPFDTNTDGLAFDADFEDALLNGGLIITKVSDSISNVSVRVSNPVLEMFVGTAKYDVCDICSNTTTINYGLDNTIEIVNDTNTFTRNLVTDLGLSAAQTTKVLEGDGTHLTITSNVYDETICPSANVLSGGANDVGNIFTTSAQYEVKSFTKSSNGYANIVTNGISYGPVPIQREVLNIDFFSNTTTGYSNVVHIHNNYYRNTIDRSSMKLDTMINIIDPSESNVSSNVLGNIFVDSVDNFLEIEGVTAINTNDFGPQGYDVFWDMRWPGANIITAKTLSNSVSNVLQDDFSDINSLTMDVYPHNEPRVQFTATSTQETIQGYPLSLVSLALSTGKRFPITYDSSNTYYQKAEVFMPTEFNNTTSFDYFLDLGEDTTFYSGPVTPIVNTDFINSYTGNAFYSSNVSYAVAGANVYLNGQDVANVTSSTWNPGISVNFDSYSNTISITSTEDQDEFTIPDEGATGYSQLLRDSLVEINNDFDLGSKNVIQDPYISRNLSNVAFAGYDSNIFMVGGLSGSNLLSTSVKNDVSNGITYNTVEMPRFDFAFRDGRMVLDTDNPTMFLFGTIDELSNVTRNTTLYKSVINTSDHVLRPWVLESSAFPGKAVEMPSVAYVNRKVVVVGGKYFGTNSINHSEIYAYDTSALAWSAITLPQTIYSFGTNGLLAAKSNIYFWNNDTNSTTDFSAISYVNVDNNFSLHTVTNSVSLTSNVVENPFINFEAIQDETKLYIIGGGKEDTRVQYIDTSTQTREAVAATTSIDQNLYGFASYHPYLSPEIVVYGGTDNGVQTARILTLSTVTNTWKDIGLNLLFQNPLYGASFVGQFSPGSLPLLQTGIKLGTKKSSILTITDQSTSNVVEVGLKRTNVFTAVSNSSIENNGIFSSWYMDIKDSSNRQIDVGWDGKDYAGNFAQVSDGSVGPVWLGDALNIETTANFYSSNIEFNSTSNLQNTFMTFNTLQVSGNTNPRTNVVTTNVFSFDVGYANVESMVNFLDYSVNGLVPFTSANTSEICITNNLNPFQPGAFVQNPTTVAKISTDNIPYQTWYFDRIGGTVTPPGNPPDTSNVMVNDAYRQFLPSRLTRSGRLDKVEFLYGTSRYTRPSNPLQYSNTFEFGVFRDGDMRARKLTLASFSSQGQETNSNAQMEIYKYFASNVGYSENSYTTERGWYDEVILSFGPDITQSGEFERVVINPGYGTAAPATGAAPLSNALQTNDTIEVLFQDYDPLALSVTANLVYRSSVVNRVISSEATVKLKTSMFNAISDNTGRSGDVIITTTYNNGLIDSNVSAGVRPVSGVNLSDADFSSNLLRCCLSTFVENGSTTAIQENVYQSVFPVNIQMNKYNPTGIYTDKVGRAILDEVSLEINGQEIEKLDDIWYVTRDELFRSDDEKNALKFLINGGQDYLPTSAFNFGPIDLYIPLDFFFCRTQKTSSTQAIPTKMSGEYRSQAPYLPLCALQDQEITVVIKFKPQEYFSNVNAPIDLSYQNTFLVTDEVMISPQERHYYKSNPQNILIEQVKRLPRQIFNFGTDLRYEGLVSDMPMKLMTWLFRSAQFEDETSSQEFLHRYNFSTIRSTNEQYKPFYELLKKANFYLDGVPLVERYGTPNFYKYYQGLNSDLSSTNKNIYTYSFSIYPTKVNPSGTINLSNSTSNKTFFSFDLEIKEASAALEQVDAEKGFSIHAYSFGYNRLFIENGRATLSFS